MFRLENIMISIIGDFHIPKQARTIPEEYLPILKKSELILCAGDLTEENTLEGLKKCSEVKAVRGNMDHVDLPEELKFDVHGIKFGMLHGSRIHPRGDLKQLIETAQRMRVDVLVNGHTHIRAVGKHGNITLLNPGSATGAESGEGILPKPSFLALDIKGKALNITAYTLDKGLVGRDYTF